MTWFRNLRAEMLERLIDELKISHAQELDRVTKELEKAQDEYQRLVRVVMPTMQQVNLPKEIKEADNEPAPVVQPSTALGTPWERVQQAWKLELEKEDQSKVKKPMPQYAFTSEGPVSTQEK